MPIRARVGRHTQAGGRQCQNWADDQQVVIALLNRIPVRDGGAGGSLTGRVVAGLSSEVLYRAISRFEDRHFPGQRSGFVDPGGPMLVRMEALAARTATPRRAASVAPPGCATISLPSLAQLPTPIQTLIRTLGLQLPSHARCLDPTEVAVAKRTYGESLVYEDIYVSDNIGASDRPFTVALQLAGRWIVALNLGPSGFRVPNFSTSDLIHELAHAWQSQHYPDRPAQFMINCVQSQAEAAVATAASKINSSRLVRIGVGLGGGGAPPDFNLGEASAYAYVPGKSFGEYGGEQIAQQVEDTLSGGVATAQITRDHMKAIPARALDPELVRALSTTRFEFENTPHVVWH